MVMKSVTVDAQPGYPQPHYVWLDDSLINAQGNPNVGFRSFMDEVVYAKQHAQTPIFTSLIATSIRDFILMGKAMEEAGADGVEVPLVTYHREDLLERFEVIRALKQSISIPIIAKLWYDHQIDALARMAKEAGADALSVIGSVAAVAIDYRTGAPLLGSPLGFGGLTGPCIKPLTQRCLAIVAKTVDIPVIACGGVSNAVDALEMILLGASCVALVTAALKAGDAVFDTIAQDMRDLLTERRVESLSDVKGASLPFLHV